MKLTRKKIGTLLRLSARHIIIDEALYDPDFPDEIELFKVLDANDPDFSSHIPDYPIYPDYAVFKLVNQGIRLLIAILYPDLKGIPVGMIEHTKLRGKLYPGDTIHAVIKKWQERSMIAKFEIAIESQKGTLVYESTLYGTVIDKA
ncbi:MAG: FabA-like domain [Deltaproteobacteria bacterium]|nr:FabA-like domain [Deltaproteobacteria bacterium]